MSNAVHNTDWRKEVKRRLMDRDMNVTDLAKELGFQREVVSIVINRGEEVRGAVNKYLGIMQVS